MIRINLIGEKPTWMRLHFADVHAYRRHLAQFKVGLKYRHARDNDTPNEEIYQHPLTLAQMHRVDAAPSICAVDDPDSLSILNPDLWSEEYERELLVNGYPIPDDRWEAARVQRMRRRCADVRSRREKDRPWPTNQRIR